MPVVTKVSKFSNRNIPTRSGSDAGLVVCNELFIDLTAAQLVLNNIFDLGILPAYNRVVDMTLVPDDLDTNGTPLVALDVGLLDGTPGDAVASRTCGAEFFSADISARTGVAARMSAATGFKVAATEADRSIGVKIQAAPATAALGRIRVLVFTCASDHKVTF